MPGTYSRVYTASTGDTITAARFNTEHDNHITNCDFAGLGDYSASNSQMQSTADPYPSASESLATAGTGELERLRYMIKQITGKSQWYVDGAAIGSKGADVASTNALPVLTDGNFFDVTGSTAITSINTLGVGSVIRLQFDGSLTLTHHSTDLILPDGQNIKTLAGDVAAFVEYASGDWFLAAYSRNVNRDGWTPAAETWTYASATTITVPTGAASLYQKGDKIKLTQTTVKYFYITTVADTLLTVTGGTDYTVANAAITSPYVSKLENPQGFPNGFAYTPTFAGFSSDPTTVSARFWVINGRCKVIIYQGGDGTSNATTFTVTGPIANAFGQAVTLYASQGRDNSAGSANVPLCLIANSSTTIDCYRDQQLTAWTGSGGKRIVYINGEYQI